VKERKNEIQKERQNDRTTERQKHRKTERQKDREQMGSSAISIKAKLFFDLDERLQSFRVYLRVSAIKGKQ
jgi:hypothetical protein